MNALDVAPKLDADLSQCSRALEEAEAVLRQKEHAGATLAGRQLAQRDRDAVQSLRAEPWFGWIDVDEGSRRSYRVAKASFPELRIVEWRHPLAKILFDCAPGEAYERPAGGRVLEGIVVAQGRVRVEERALQHVAWTDQGGRSEAVRDGDVFVDANATREAPRAPRVGLPEIVALLTPEQYRLIARSSERPLIIQGQAGSGKTTVALHRLSWLAYPGETEEADDLAASTRAVEPSRALIVMFNKALSTFARTSLEPLKLEAARLDTFHGWALETVRVAYKGVIEPRATPVAGQEVAHRLKAQLGILSAIDSFVAGQAKRIEGWLEEKLPSADRKAWLERYRNEPGAVVRRLIASRTAALEERDAASGAKRQRLENVYQVFRAAVTRTTLYKEELQRLLTDRSNLKGHLTASDDELEALASYQAARQGERAPEGKKIGPYVDFDDLALILRLIQAKHGGLPNADESVSLYDHLVVDEVQDFGAVQLMVLLSAVKSRTGVTIVGDVNQKIVPDADFMGWEALATELGLGGVDVARLEVGHRSTQPIMKLANHIAGLETADSGRSGPVPRLERCAGDEDLMDRVAAYLRTRASEAPQAHLCVVCSSRSDVAKTLDALRAELADATVEIREGHNASFKFGPGITVTNWRQVKGLEFDTVVAMNPTPAVYPDTEVGRRALYVVATRAQELLVVFADGEVTPLLDRALEAGVLEEQDAVAPVSLGSDEEPL